MNFGESLVHWFCENQREMPWRKTRDPYCIWVSEVMLQQTQVDTVIPYYNRFIKRFPTMHTLSDASLEEVLTLWKGLGYYRRAENLHKGVKKIVNEMSGLFPSSKETLAIVPGIGDYTVGAVLSIAFDQPLPAVDGNVMRVLSRQFLVDEDISKAKARKTFEKLVLELMTDKPSLFNQGLMELGALICTPQNPKCEGCPVKPFCKAHIQGEVEEYPIKSKKVKPETEEYVAVILRRDATFLMEKRPEQGLLANLWGFPLVKPEAFILPDAPITFLEPVVHIFTHKKWLLKPVIMEYTESNGCIPGALTPQNRRFFSMEEMKELPIGGAFMKIIGQVGLQLGHHVKDAKK